MAQEFWTLIGFASLISYFFGCAVAMYFQGQLLKDARKECREYMFKCWDLEDSSVEHHARAEIRFNAHAKEQHKGDSNE